MNACLCVWMSLYVNSWLIYIILSDCGLNLLFLVIFNTIFRVWQPYIFTDDIFFNVIVKETDVS